MSTRLGTLKNTGSRDVALDITRFHGGIKKGSCLQLSAQMEDGAHGYVQLSSQDIISLFPIFEELIKNELSRRLKSVREIIEENKSLEETLLKDIRATYQFALNQPALDFSSFFAFGKQNLVKGETNENK